MKTLHSPHFGFQANTAKERPSIRLTLQVFKKFCEDKYGNRLFIHTRKRGFIEDRCMVFNLIYKEGLYTYEDIGMNLGGYDHATVLYHVKKKFMALYETYPDFRHKYDKLELLWMEFKKVNRMYFVNSFGVVKKLHE